MDKQHPNSVKIQELRNTLLTADGFIKAIDQLAVDALGDSNVCEAVYCLLTTLQRFSNESLDLADQLADIDQEAKQCANMGVAK